MSSQHSNKVLEYNGSLSRITVNDPNVARFDKQVEDTR